MSDPGIISVHVHLGDMGKEILHLEDDSERSDWLLGFHAGTLGREPRPGWSLAKACGFNFGASAFVEAREFQAKKARGGHASAEKRREKYGSAQPNSLRTGPEQISEHNTEQTPNSVRDSEQCSEAVREITEQHPEQPPNQPTAYRQQPAASSQNNQQPQPAASESQPVTVTPRARPANAPAAPGWSAETAKEIREARASDRRQKWITAQAGQVDFTVRPSILQFLSYCRAVHPSWHERAAREAFDTWATHNWTFERRKISSWWQLTDAFAFAADHSEHNERVPMGGVVAGLGGVVAGLGIADQLSAKAAGLTTGERI